MCNVTLDSLIKSLSKSSLINKDEAKAVKDFAALKSCERPLSLYIQFFIALGIAITLCFFAAFFYTIGAFSSPIKLLSLGIGFIITAVIFLKVFNFKSEMIKQTVQVQLSLCAMLLGKWLFVIGFYGVFKSFFGLDLSLVVPVALITIITYRLYDVPLDRFVSSLALFILLFIDILSKDYNGTFRPLFVNFFSLFMTILIGVTFFSKKNKTFYIPMAYAAIFTLSVVIAFALRKILFDVGAVYTYHLKFINILLTFELVLLILYIGVMSQKPEPTLLSIIIAILLGVMYLTGAVFSIILLLLGYAKDQRLLMAIGMILLPIFLVIHYYSLDLTLINKAILLGGGGVLLLLGKAYIACRNFDRAM